MTVGFGVRGRPEAVVWGGDAEQHTKRVTELGIERERILVNGGDGRTSMRERVGGLGCARWEGAPATKKNLD